MIVLVFRYRLNQPNGLLKRLQNQFSKENFTIFDTSYFVIDLFVNIHNKIKFKQASTRAIIYCKANNTF